MTLCSQVLIYNGQNDVILGPALCENFLRSLSWSGSREYLKAERLVWKLAGSDEVMDHAHAYTHTHTH